MNALYKLEAAADTGAMNPTLATPEPLPQALRLTFAMLMLVLSLAALDQTIVSTALPTITRELHGAARMSWVFSAYLIAATVAVPLYGKLADLHGTRPVLLVAVSVFLAGSALCGLSRDMTELILARGAQGAGGGGLLTLAMMAVVRSFPPSARARLQGLLGAVYGLSTMAGPLAGGFIVEHMSWRWAFLINLPVGLVALVMLARLMPRQKPMQPGAMDYAGAVLLGAALVCLMLGTRPAEPGAAGYIVLGLLLGAAFIAVQMRAAQPLLPLSLFAERGFAAASLMSCSTGFTLFAAVVFMPLFWQTVRGLSPADSGWHSMPLMAGITLGSIACGRMLAMSGRVRPVAMAGCVVTAIAFVLLGVLLREPGVSLAWVSACLFPLGLGIGVLLPLVTVVAQASAPLPLMGIATASPVMFRSVAGAVGVSAMAALFQHVAAADGLAVVLQREAAFRRALFAVFCTAAGVALLTAVASRGLPQRLARPAAGPGAAPSAVPA